MALPTIKATTKNGEQVIKSAVKKIAKYLTKHKALPPVVTELSGKNVIWRCSGGSIGVKAVNQDGSAKKESAVIRALVDAAIERKYILARDKKNPKKNEEKREVLAEMKRNGDYVPAKQPGGGNFKGFTHEAVSPFGTKIKAQSKASLDTLMRLDKDLQPVIKAFGTHLINLRETRSKKALGMNKGTDGRIMSIKTQGREYEDIFYTALHELAHNWERNHYKAFKDKFGELVMWCFDNRYPRFYQKLYDLAQSDSKYRPTIR